MAHRGTMTRVALGTWGVCSALILATQGCSGSESNAEAGDAAVEAGHDGTVLVDGGAPDRGEPDTGTVPSRATCDECLYGECSAPYATCQDDLECQRIYRCATETCAPGDGQCVQFCYDAHPAGQRDYLDLAICDAYHACGQCVALCQPSPASCSEDAGAPPPYCSECVERACRNEKDACRAGTECARYWDCTAECSDVACLERCDSTFAGGKAASDALRSCLEQQCRGPCAF